MNTKGIIWEPICMLNAGEGTFCNAGVWVMLQLSPTLSLGGSADAIVLLLHVYHSLFRNLCLFPFPPCPRSPVLSLSLSQTPLYLHSTSSFHLRQTKCSIFFPSVVMKWEEGGHEGGEQGKKEKRRGGITVTDKSAPKQQRCSHTFIRWTGSCCFVITPFVSKQTHICATVVHEVMQYTHAYDVGEQAGFFFSTFRFWQSSQEAAAAGTEWDLERFCMFCTTNSIYNHCKMDERMDDTSV